MLQEAAKHGPHRANTGTHWLSHMEFQSPPHLLLVQGVVLQSIHLQELLGHADAGQLCKDTKVAGHPEACKGETRIVGMGWGANFKKKNLSSIDTDSWAKLAVL